MQAGGSSPVLAAPVASAAALASGLHIAVIVLELHIALAVAATAFTAHFPTAVAFPAAGSRPGGSAPMVRECSQRAAEDVGDERERMWGTREQGEYCG